MEGEEDDDAVGMRRYLKAVEDGKRTSETFHKSVGMCLRELDELDELEREVRSCPPSPPSSPSMDALAAMLTLVELLAVGPLRCRSDKGVFASSALSLFLFL